MTIYALSSGPGLSGIAVIRLSGPNSKEVIEKLTKEKHQNLVMHLLKKFIN